MVISGAVFFILHLIYPEKNWLGFAIISSLVSAVVCGVIVTSTNCCIKCKLKAIIEQVFESVTQANHLGTERFLIRAPHQVPERQNQLREPEEHPRNAP